MAYLKFTSLEIRNFQTIGELVFPINQGKYLITGANGNGKSSIMEALVWGLYKKSMRGTDPSTHGKGNLFVAVDFLVDRVPHRVERTLKMSRGGSGVKLYCNDVDISARISTEVDAQVESIIGIPYELFISSCVVLQGLPVSFTQFTPSLRKSIFEGIVGFSIWDNYKAKIDRKSKELYTTLNIVQDEFALKEREMVDLNARIETLESANKDQATTIKAKIRALKIEITGVELGTNSLAVELAGMVTPGSVFSEVSKEKERLHTLKSKAANLKSLITGTCQVCGQEYKEKEKSKKELVDIEHSILQVEGSVHSINLRYEVTQKVYNQNNMDLSSARATLKSLKGQFSSLSSELAECSQSTDLESHKLSLDQLNTEVNLLNEELKKVEKEKSHYDWISSTLQPSSRFRTEVLTDYIAIVTKTIHNISPIIFSNTKIGLRVNEKATGIEIDVEKDGNSIEYKQLSGGEKRRLDAIITLSIQIFLMNASGNRTNLIVLDEFLESLDQEGMDAIVNVLDVVFPDSAAVYMITHNSALKSRFPNNIHVTKEEGRSVVHV